LSRAVFLRAAQRDLVGLQEDLTHLSGSLRVAREFVAKLRDRCHHLASLPGMLGRERPELGHDLRSIPHGDYIIVFRYSDAKLQVVAIVHGARDIDALMGKEN
jgi:toxin ParE1/3/4